MKYSVRSMIVGYSIYCTMLSVALSPACLQLKQEIMLLKNEMQTIAKSAVPDQARMLTILPETNTKLKELAAYWPEVKQEFDGQCALIYDQNKNVVQQCCDTLSCQQVMQDPQSSEETKKNFKVTFEACKKQTLTEPIYNEHLQCIDFVQLMFEAAMQTGNRKTLSEIKAYTTKYWQNK